MELYRPRSSSIPRHLRQIPANQRFTVADAAQLKLKLQALDDKLERNADIHTLKSACQGRPFHEEIYMDGSEQFFMLVNSVMRPDLIPDVYIEAYAAVQQGRYHLNQYRVSDFKKGVDPTFSEIRGLLGKIDAVCGTKLDASYRALEDEVKPFPLLRLPAELRLEVYSHLVPREAHIAVLAQAQPHRDHKPPRLRLDLLRVNRQLHDEATKYFYENRTLFMVAARDKGSELLSNEFVSRYYETVAVMSASTRLLFTKLELQIGYFSNQIFTPRRYQNVPSATSPMQQMLTLLPSLTSVVISFGLAPAQLMGSNDRIIAQRNDTLKWLLENIPQTIEVSWDETITLPLPGRVEDPELSAIMRSRGPLKQGESVATRLEVKKREKIRQNFFLDRSK
ncbi:hypothetical protein FB567DRAFT_185212 [Paraphoma chrysanthemicola]|uniref:F-box domain-containing protein n=1 Tax=Paraphoma chrysanthemicola TaxID=798071 RepID=A0A8K0QXC7_9PLEO|nr:hypothetical protein FB567DRAFT_185212 [Paraphoma chrysanthemicola]